MQENMVQLIAAAIGSLLAGFLGVTFAMARTKRERAFDRRLEWYEQGVTATRALALAIYELVHIERTDHPDQEERVRKWKALPPAIDSFFQVTPRAHMYANRQTHRLMGVVNQRGQELSALIAHDATPHPNADQLNALEQLSELLQRTALMLAMDVRSHLGLESLKDPWHTRLRHRITGRRQ
jgi:hypothetical protein